ncbi:ATP-binding protein, partial [Mobiluncus mulieris]|nr:ATP-binding protein [Mobiluncus mulieris]NMX02128.1 ATP-binding protein [Mobiluncus mulieris]NMX19539.1 ATP-binding protein [Mobiluncus mulieris]
MHKSVTRMKRHQLKSLLRWVFPSFKPHPAILTAIFAFTAAFSFMAETIMGTFSDRVMEPSSTIVLLVLMVSLALCGIFPPYFESLFILLSSIYFGLFGSLTTPTLGIYVLVGVWLVRSWIIPGLLLLLVTEISLTAVSPHPSLQAIGAVFGSGVTIALGLAIRYFRLKTTKANTQAEHSRRQTEQARREAELARREARET